MKHIAASTLIEVLVASVIFLLLFAISMQTLGKITTKSSVAIEIMEAENKIAMLYRQSRGADIGTSTTKEYEWGQITAATTRYKDYSDITQLTITAYINRRATKIVRCYIIENEK